MNGRLNGLGGYHVIDQQRGRLRHPPRAAAWAKAAALAAERNELLGVTVRARHAQKTVLEAAAFQIRLELLLYVFRRRPALCRARLAKGGVVLLDNLMEQKAADLHGLQKANIGMKKRTGVSGLDALRGQLDRSSTNWNRAGCLDLPSCCRRRTRVWKYFARQVRLSSRPRTIVMSSMWSLIDGEYRQIMLSAREMNSAMLLSSVNFHPLTLALSPNPLSQ